MCHSYDVNKPLSKQITNNRTEFISVSNHTKILEIDQEK